MATRASRKKERKKERIDPMPTASPNPVAQPRTATRAKSEVRSQTSYRCYPCNPWLQFPLPQICVYSCLPRRSLGVGGSIRGYPQFAGNRCNATQPMQTVFEKSLVNYETSGHTQPPFCRQTTEQKL